ncbi:alpha/beta hydrolase family esterase [Thermus thermophilus]|uniref:extracellular catalytic domain type 1 short-chain-length polyhydroxyalkanoate depolymerase n=1 Tax=Thermus thermophilus TaxID=274 RepID=UPI001165C51B|nr:PHB depolymerase family esterase [Thermus thermophilus]BBL84257.1 hypothetical protein TthAA229_07380 [Thermus thermophilus]
MFSLAGCGQLGSGPKERKSLVPRTVVMGSFTHPEGTRNFRLYLPPRTAELPLMVLLHGCTQTAQDFALGTSMDRLADQLGFAVLYPEQLPEANGSRCWNWFDPSHQDRGSGEPAILADMAAGLAQKYGLYPSQMAVAGLSAGGAMAVILAATYPDRFAFLGVVAGLEYKAAKSLPEAFAAMATGGPDPSQQGLAVCQSWGRKAYRLPLLVFHGDSDTTVNPVNGEQVYQHWLVAHQACGSAQDLREQRFTVNEGGRSATVRQMEDGQGILAEFWLVQGMGHRWPGGNALGSYTDPQGPEASRRIAERWTAILKGGE